MKIAIPILGLLACFGIAYALAFFGVLPVQKMADKSPGFAHTLIALHLAKAKKQAASSPASTPSPAAASSPTVLSSPLAQAAAPAPDTAGKLSAIYAAMSADDLVTIFSKLPDPDVVSALMDLDEKKAGKVLAALPPARAAHLTQEMSHPQPVSHAIASL